MAQGTKSGVVAVVDVGSTHVACLVARVTPSADADAPNIHVTGASHVKSEGVGAAGVTDLKAAEKAIRTAIDAAEQRAGVTLERVVVASNAGKPKARLITTELELGGGAASPREIRLLDAHARRSAGDDGSVLMHFIRRFYCGDDGERLEDPEGMRLSTLSADYCLVEADQHAWANLSACVEASHVKIAKRVVSPLAAAIACLSSDEAHQGVVCVDIGGSATSYAVFEDGALSDVGLIRIGSQHITNDIAMGLNITMEDAEHHKMLNGNAMAASDFVDEADGDLLDSRPAGGGGRQISIRRGDLNMILRARVDEILDMVEQKIGADAFGGRIRNIVLSGGGSRLHGLELLVQSRFGLPVRLGRPEVIRGMPEVLNGPTGCVLAGLLLVAADAPQAEYAGLASGAESGFWTRVGHWWSENFY